ncbi:alpha-ribazole phosphatase family protein [Paraburkholderia rhizosphaerae]|uniref:Alpha-ribazole phosphatase n=1 Tax=Paraburkholderia rhizosphaerae TaxID=480658 RepID=A0A4R8LK17_9BURK|nr:alpha-ribazole phosphatase family protein [Paraburkholderia rhizosphaerae]TDY44406.1 alpha-ribazole phosphatase [Paraburkholderia rhizosphaerae]
MDVVLIRHPAVNVDAGVCYGDSDVPLAAGPDVSAEALAVRLATLQVPAPRVVLTSPLTRCATVAASLAANFGCSVSSDDSLKEMHFGTWELQRWDDIDRALLDAWAEDFEGARVHGGESVAQFVSRVRTWFDVFEQTRELSPAYVVTHAGVMRVIAALTLGLGIDACLPWVLDSGALVWLRRNDATMKWAIVRWNA